MKKKFFNVVLLVAIAIAASASFVSCTDETGDDYNNLAASYLSLAEVIDQQKVDLANLTQELDELNKEVFGGSSTTSGKSISDKIEEINNTLNNVDGTGKSLSVIYEELTEKISYTTTLIEELGKKLDENYYTKTEINDTITSILAQAAAAQARADAAYAFAEANKKSIDSLANEMNNYYTKEEIDSMKKEAEEKVAEAKAAADKAQETANNAESLAKEALSKIETVTTKLSELETALNDKAKELQDQIDAIKSEIEKIYTEIRGDLAKLITGVITQGAYNPVMGQFALPVGIQSNILFGFFGENTSNGFEFPLDIDGIDLEEVDNVQSLYIGNGEKLVSDLENGKAYLGTLFTTINPNTVDFTGQTLKFVDSQDEECGVELEPLEKSNETLSFGYTRAANNGFYQTNAYVPADKVESVRITKNLDKSKLKTVAAEVLNKIKNRSASSINLANIYKVMMETIKDVMPAYGLKASWTDSQGEHSIYSNYNLAATSVKPASYDFLKGANIPTIPHLGYITYDVDFNLDYPEYEYIENPNLNLTVYVVKTAEGVVIGVYSDETEANNCVAANPGSGIETKTFTVSGLQSFIDTINNDIIQKLTDDIKDLENQITSQTQSNVNKALGKVNTKVVDRVNSWIDRLNPRLQDANYYLQPTMLVQGADDVWYLASDSWITPHTYQGTGYVLVEPTSITAEILAPAYKKYLAVTNVFENGKPAASAKNGNNTCKNILAKANAAVNADGAENMNTVFSGNKDVAFYASAVGYTYEITYAAVDYTGRTRVTKWYVKTI